MEHRWWKSPTGDQVEMSNADQICPVWNGVYEVDSD
jgi:hypothetical protein